MADTAIQARYVDGPGWKSTGHAVAFWIPALLGLPVMVCAWFLLPFVSLEEVTEQGKAEAAGTTMAGLTLYFAVIPLIVAHVLGLVILGAIAITGRHPRRSGVLYAVPAVVIASAIGVAVALLVSGGELIVPPSRYVP